MKNKKSTQNLFGLRTFGKYSLQTDKAELAFFSVQPTNISVLSAENIDVNKVHIKNRLKSEGNPNVRKLLKQDAAFLDDIQVEMSTARQFLFCIRFRDKKEEQIFQQINRTAKVISEHGFDVRRMGKSDVKRMLAIYLEASMHGEKMSDIEGENYLETA